MRAACESVDGVKDVNVEFDRKEVTVTYDPKKALPDAFVRAIEDAGYSPKIVEGPPS